MNRLEGIRELVLQSDDPDRMVAFYERVGLRLLSREGDRAWLAVGEGARLGIWCPGEKEHGDRSIYLSDPEGNRVEIWDYFDHGYAPPGAG